MQNYYINIIAKADHHNNNNNTFRFQQELNIIIKKFIILFEITIKFKNNKQYYINKAKYIAADK